MASTLVILMTTKLLLYIVFCVVMYVPKSESDMIENLLTMFGDLDFGDSNDDLTPEAKLDAMGLIRYYGYPAESHTVVTSDGYILEMHRIPGGRHNFSHVDRQPVLVVHGFLSCSGNWVANGPANSLGFVLADEGFDVWLANLRGNRYSRRHITISPEDNTFWNFCLDDFSLLDLPAMIDHILELTKREKLTYIGHSMGTSISLLLLSEKLEYNAKLKPVILLAPVAYSAFIKSSLLLLRTHGKVLKTFSTAISGTNELLSNTDFLRDLVNFVCTNEIGYVICHSLVVTACGYNEELFPDNFNAIVVQYIGGTSWHVIHHFEQLYVDQKFSKYRGGRIEKFTKFGQTVSLNYNITRITAPIAILYGYMDLVSDVRDVKRLASELENLVVFEEVSHPFWTHLDFASAKNAKFYLYDRLIEIIKKHA